MLQLVQRLDEVATCTRYRLLPLNMFQRSAEWYCMQHRWVSKRSACGHELNCVQIQVLVPPSCLKWNRCCVVAAVLLLVGNLAASPAV
jgi:hypothetical protein